MPASSETARAAILVAATRCIARSGVRGMRVNDVAREAGVSPGLLYYHFTDRAGLLAATLEHVNTQALDRGDAKPRSGNDAYRPHSLLLDELRDDPANREAAIAWNELRSCAIFEPELATAVTATTQKWNDAIAAALPGEAAPASAELLTSLVEGLSARWLSGSMTSEHAQRLLAQAINAVTTVQPIQE